MQNLRIFIGTYNVGTQGPKQDLQEFLHFISLSNSKHSLPDLCVLGFQEVKSKPQNRVLDALFNDPWTYTCGLVLRTYDYVLLKTIRLQGLLLNVHCLRKHILHIKQIESDYTRTGFSGMWGNKGAVSIRLDIFGCSLCFVNAHLSAHDHNLDHRIEDYNNIIKQQEFHVNQHKEIFYHDYVFWMGDLNFRLLEDFDSSPEFIAAMVERNNLPQLFRYDQLRYVMHNGLAFQELTEQDPKFPPTFKFEEGTQQYDTKRRPAWCDRILYRVNSNNHENVTLKLDQLSYNWHPAYNVSDHRPVSAEFQIKVFSEIPHTLVCFDAVSSWIQSEENSATFSIREHENFDADDDWIGLFKEKYASLYDFVAYEYVSKAVSHCQASDGDSKNRQKSKYKVTFSELPGRCEGNYCLIYFAETEDKVASVLGISDCFPVIKQESD